MQDYNRAVLKVFPQIGVARVGASETGWFLGPEVPGVVRDVASYMDALRRISRQGVRFQVADFFPDGPVEALDLADHEFAEMQWTVKLRNAKADWTQFGDENAPLRSSRVTDESREDLVIGAAGAGIAGPNAEYRPFAGDFLK